MLNVNKCTVKSIKILKSKRFFSLTRRPSSILHQYRKAAIRRDSRQQKLGGKRVNVASRCRLPLIRSLGSSHRNVNYFIATSKKTEEHTP